MNLQNLVEYYDKIDTAEIKKTLAHYQEEIHRAQLKVNAMQLVLDSRKAYQILGEGMGSRKDTL